MDKFKVVLSKTISATIEIEAKNAEEAEDEAIYQLMRGMVELEGGCAFDDINVAVEKMTSETEEGTENDS